MDLITERVDVWAAAIDRGASWEEISACAEAEGVHQLAAALFNPEQEHSRGTA